VIQRAMNSFDAAVFLETDFKTGPVVVTPGIRYSRGRYHGQMRWAFDPRLWVRWNMQDGAALKGSVGLYSQPPDPTDMEDIPLGNPGLKHEKAFQASLGAEYRITDAINVDITGYYNRRYENVVNTNGPLTNPDGSPAARIDNLGLGRAYGIEVMLRHEVTREFFGWISYTLNRSETRRVGEEEYNITAQDQTHLLTMVGSYRLPFGWELGLRFRYVTGRPYTPLNHQYDLYNSDSNRFFRNPEDPFSARLNPFHQLDFRVDKSFLFESWTLTAYVDVQNLYNATNVEAQFPDYRFRESVDVPGIPILPVIGVKGTF
jgi:outer membrane receptor for ferrienterochelin and colicin